jgi:[ribosomal protein S5]-alanine N-acetyltransferase
MMLHTNRLHLREIALSDISSIHTLYSLPQTDEFNTLGIPETMAVTQKIVNDWVRSQTSIPRTAYIFCLELTESKQFIGLIALSLGKPNYRIAEVWFKIHAAYWNNGYATEALKELLQFGFNQLKLHRIEAGCAVENTASAKVLEKSGMIKEGMKRKILPVRGAWVDNYFYAILEEDFH